MDQNRRNVLKAKHRDLWRIVESAVCSEDPLGLIELGCADDEYDPEIGTILPRIKSANSEADLCKIIHEEFEHWFGASAGPQKNYESMAKKIWENYRAMKDV